MALVFLTKAQKGRDARGDRYGDLSNFPAHARPVSVVAHDDTHWYRVYPRDYKPTDQPVYAMQHRNQWRRLEKHRDWKTGTSRWMMGSSIDPVMVSS